MNDLPIQFNDGGKLAVEQQHHTKGADDENTFMHCCGSGNFDTAVCGERRN